MHKDRPPRPRAMMQSIDPVQYGRLLSSVDHLTKQLNATSERLEVLDARLEEIEGRFRVGKGFSIGLLVAIGYAVYGVKELITSLFGK